MRAAERVEAELAGWMAEEAFLPGERIGSEREVAERFGVSRTVLRQVIERLEGRGEIRRLMGRSGGIFAHDGKLQRQLNTTLGTPMVALQQGFRVRTEVLDAVSGPCTPSERRRLELAPGDEVVRIRRLRSVEGLSWSLDRSVLPAARFGTLLAEDLTGSIFQLLRERCGAEISRTSETVEGVGADAGQAEALQVPVASPLLLLQRVTTDAAGTPLEIAQDAFRADRTRLQLTSLGANWKRAVGEGASKGARRR